MALDQQNDSSKLLLYAVNTLLKTIGERPIADDVELADVLEAQLAYSAIIETKKEVLSEGWNFNKDKGVEFPPTSDGYIAIPDNVLDISSVDSNLIMRDWRLYSRKDNSAKFTEPQTVDVIWDLDFNSLTHPIRNYITKRSARLFLAQQAMDTNVFGFTQNDVEEAHIIARRSDGFTGRYNMLNSQYGLDHIVGGL